MLEIKTILTNPVDPVEFDKQVNNALRDGWELVRRDFLLKPSALYAELEREIEPEEPEETEDDSVAEWRITRNPVLPYKCTACGAAYGEPSKTCPRCKRAMVTGE